MAFLDKIPLSTILIFCATLGLAPFVPEPHVWQKLKMLVSGELTRPLDMFDLVFHGWTWALLVAKLARMGAQARHG